MIGRLRQAARQTSASVVDVVQTGVHDAEGVPFFSSDKVNQVAERRREVELSAQANLFRDIIGNPFNTVAVGPAWLTPDVIALARAIYDERAFERLGVLATARECAVCGNADTLAHCREPGEPVRDCWVIDGLLGKE